VLDRIGTGLWNSDAWNEGGIIVAFMQAFICVTCGTQFPPSAEPPAECPICLDPRQYVGPNGQEWTTLEELARTHENRLEQVEPGLDGVGTRPGFAIGQRALVAGGVLWDCITLVDDSLDGRGVHTIAISHPHYYSAMVEWAERLDARILLHEADREHVMRPSDRIEFWSGDRRRASDEVELVRLGGHFAGGTVALWNRALLSGDIVQVVPDRDWTSFMYSYPNLIPLPAAEVERMRAVLESLDFDRVYGAWWDRVIPEDGKTKVLRSADRYLAALSGILEPRGR
jgi:hypothetical protein